MCGKPYQTCYSCERNKSWRLLTDTLDHYEILCVLMDYRGDGDAQSASSALSEYGISPGDNPGFLPEVDSLIQEIHNVARGSGTVDDPDGSLVFGVQ